MIWCRPEVFNAMYSGKIPAGWDWIGYMGWSGAEILQSAYDLYNVKVLPCCISSQETGGCYNKDINDIKDFDGLCIMFPSVVLWLPRLNWN